MGNHSPAQIEILENKLKERYENLLQHMRGSPVNATDIHARATPEHFRSVNPSEVRIAIDDFSTILKEIKATLGKR